MKSTGSGCGYRPEGRTVMDSIPTAASMEPMPGKTAEEVTETASRYRGLTPFGAGYDREKHLAASSKGGRASAEKRRRQRQQIEQHKLEMRAKDEYLHESFRLLRSEVRELRRNAAELRRYGRKF